jgi:NitT/TauT family transport system substrate-binding protein
LAVKPEILLLDEALLTTVAKRYKDQDAWCKDPVMKKESLDLLQKVIKTAGQLKKEAPYDIVADTKYAEKAIKSVK